MNVSRLGSGHQPAVIPALTPSFLQENLPINIDKSEIVNTAYNKVDGIPEVDKEKIKNTTFKRIKADPVFILGKQLDVVYKVVQRAVGAWQLSVAARKTLSRSLHLCVLRLSEDLIHKALLFCQINN